MVGYIYRHWEIPWNRTRLYASYININSLAPGKFEWNFRHVIFKQILVVDGLGICCEIALIWMPLDFTDDQSTLVQVMAWCHQAANHYLSQCWHRSLSPSGITRPQWVNSLRLVMLCVKFCQQRSGLTIDSGNGLLPDGTKPCPEPMSSYH